jgi:hypothetical protein
MTTKFERKVEQLRLDEGLSYSEAHEIAKRRYPQLFDSYATELVKKRGKKRHANTSTPAATPTGDPQKQLEALRDRLVASGMNSGEAWRKVCRDNPTLRQAMVNQHAAERRAAWMRGQPI